MKWTVELPERTVEVEAVGYLVLQRALVFYSDPECAPWQTVVAYAPGQWISLAPTGD